MADTESLTLRERVTAGIGRFFAPRMGIWLYLSIAMVVGVWWAAGHMLKILLWKLVLLTIAGFIGDKIARFMEGNAPRPHQLREWARASGEQGNLDDAAQLEARANSVLNRRAAIIVGAMIAAALAS